MVGFISECKFTVSKSIGIHFLLKNDINPPGFFVRAAYSLRNFSFSSRNVGLQIGDLSADISLLSY